MRRPAVLALGGLGAAVLLLGIGFVGGLAVDRGDFIERTSSDAPGGPGGMPWGDPGDAFRGPGSGGGPVPGQGRGQDQGQGQGQDQGQGRGRGPGWGPGDRPMAGVTVGRITAVNGTELTVAAAGGTPVKVTTTSSTVVVGAGGGSVADLQVGQVVLVRGTRGDDGSVAATEIRTGDRLGQRMGRSRGSA